MFLSFFIHALLIFAMTIYLQFLPLMSVFKSIALLCSLLYLFELFFSHLMLDLNEGGLIYKKNFFELNPCKITIIKFCHLKLLMVRLNGKRFLLLRDVALHYILIKKYMNHYTSGGVNNW